MRRGLKPAAICSSDLRIHVTRASPMRRGLKLDPQDPNMAAFGVTRASPMRRGLKQAIIDAMKTSHQGNKGLPYEKGTETCSGIH